MSLFSWLRGLFRERMIHEEDMCLGEVKKFDTLDYPYGPDRYYAISAVGRTRRQMAKNAIIEEVGFDCGRVYRDHFLRNIPKDTRDEKRLHARAAEMINEAFEEKSG